MKVYQFTYDATTHLIIADKIGRAVELLMDGVKDVYIEDNTLRYRWNENTTEVIHINEFTSEGLIHTEQH